MSDSAPQLVPAVDRAVRMLSSLRRRDAARSISDLARELRIPKSSAFQIATTLVHHGLLERDDATRRYRLGAAVERLAPGKRLRADLPVLAVRHLQRLAETTGLTALLGMPTAEGTVLAARGDGPASLGIGAPVGFRLDPRAGAFGKVFDAELGGATLQAALARLPRFTARSISEPAAYREELRRVRARGFATDFDEYLDGVRAVAAPVREANDQVVAAVCALGIAARLKRSDVATVAEEVCRAARALSRDLGGEDPRPQEGS